MTGIRSSVRTYEQWLEAQLGEALVRADLKAKHGKMDESAFLFLRATCWRWAETAAAICPDLADAPPVASVVDAHVGNFGLWRDGEGRLVWGVNDYDEAAVTPWPFDLVRLAASALLADTDERRSARDVAAAIVEGYRDGLARPAAFVLERDRLWLRDLFAAGDKKRLADWTELLEAKRFGRTVPKPFRRALETAMPEPGLEPKIARRVAGAGSLGRLRLVASIDCWRGGPLAREAKAVVPSCWDPRSKPGALYRLASGLYRSPDPCLQLHGAVVVRRLAPNSRKIDIAELRERGRLRLLKAMARDIAAVHADDAPRRAAILADLKERRRGWLRDAARAVAEATTRDWKTWKGR